MSSRDTLQRHNSNLSGMDQNLNEDIEELSSTFEKMMRPHKSQYTYPRTQATPTSTSSIIAKQQQSNADEATTSTVATTTTTTIYHMDLPSRMRAIKVINVILARLWRRRCAEVCDLHELVRKYQLKTSTMRDDIFLRNRMICKEQRRCDQLEIELRQAKYAAELSSQGYNNAENALDTVRRKEAKLRRELHIKTQECNSFAELLNATKTEMFRELSKFRQCAHELAEQQRQNRILEIRNAELEDEILTLKDRFQAQHDDIVLAVHSKQEKIDRAYEALKGYELELAELELKHAELLKETRSDETSEEFNEIEQKMGFGRYMIYLINPNRWQLMRSFLPNFKFVAHEIYTRFFDVLFRNPASMPMIPVASVGICITIILLIGALF